MKPKVTSRQSKYKTIIAVLSVLLAIAVTLLVLEKLNITKFYTKKSSTSLNTGSQTSEASTAQPTNKVDYGAAKPEDSTVIPEKSNSTPSPAVNSELSAVITRTLNNSANTAYLIKVAVTGTDAGNCTATMTKGSKVLTASSGISLSGGQYSCTDLSIPLSSLNETGTWSLSVTVTDKLGATASTSKEVII